jgi:hypothetical protein
MQTQDDGKGADLGSQFECSFEDHSLGLKNCLTVRVVVGAAGLRPVMPNSTFGRALGGGAMYIQFIQVRETQSSPINSPLRTHLLPRKEPSDPARASARLFERRQAPRSLWI